MISHFRIILYAFLFLPIISRSESKELIPTKLIKTNSFMGSGPTPTGLTDSSKDLMPGNGSDGFFFRDDGNGKGMCRIKTKVVCDYGIGIRKPAKFYKFTITMGNSRFEEKLQEDGTLDMFFRCDRKQAEGELTILIGLHVQKATKDTFPSEFVIDGDSCKK